MTTAYPGSLDTVSSQLRTDITASTDMNASGHEHHTMHVNVNGAVVKLETKLGTDSSNSAPSTGAVLMGTGSGASAWDTSPTILGALTVGADGSGHDVTFYSGTTGDSFVWDSSEEKLTITGTNGQVALAVADGNVTIADDLDVDGTTNLDVVDIDGAVDMATTLTLGGNADFNGDLDVDGTTNLDAVDIDGNVQLDGTLTVGVDDTGHDVKFFGATLGAYMEWDESADKLTVNKGDVLFAATDSGEKVHWNGTSSDPVLIIHGTSATDVLTVTQGRVKFAQRFYSQATDDIDLDAVSGAAVFGNSDGTGQHIAIDKEEIQSKSDATTASDLKLNTWGGQCIFPNGAVGTPGIRFTGNDADTGFYRIANQQIGLSANGIAAAWSITAGSDAGLAVGAWSAVVGGTDKDIYRNATYGTLFYSSSKRALKENIQSISDIGSVVDALNPVTFIAAATGEETSGEKAWRENDLIYGFVAEEVAGIADGKLATYDVDGESLVPSNWKTRDMVALLAAELKSVRQRLTALES